MEQTGMRTFITVWVGQLFSLVGSGLTQFALGIWVYQKTGSATLFAMIGMAAILPAVLVAPFAGVMVDRWDRRRTMIAADTAAALGTLSVAAVLWFGELQTWHIIAYVTLAAVAGSFQQPAYQASITLLVPKEMLSRAAGMVQLGEPMSSILAPVLAGALFGTIGLAGILSVDVVTFVIAMAALAIVRFPAPPPRPKAEDASPSMRREMREGWQFIAERPGLVILLVFFCVLNFVFAFSNALFVPYVLTMANEATLGLIMSAAGIGGLAGGVLASTWAGPARKTVGVFGFGAAISLAMMVVGLAGSAWVVGVALCIGMFFLPLVNASSQALWQQKTDPGVQGRVFALRRMVALAAIPIAYMTAGPLADYVFAPGMNAGGALADALGPIFGVGPGRGYGVMFAITGVLATATSLVPLLIPAWRNLEDRLPDAIPDAPVPVVG
jgi:MFS family permease